MEHGVQGVQVRAHNFDQKDFLLAFYGDKNFENHTTFVGEKYVNRYLIIFLLFQMRTEWSQNISHQIKK